MPDELSDHEDRLSLTPGATCLRSSSQARGVAAGFREAFDDIGADRIEHHREDDGDVRVACCSVAVGGIVVLKMTSGASATSAAAYCKSWRGRPGRPSGGQSTDTLLEKGRGG